MGDIVLIVPWSFLVSNSSSSYDIQGKQYILPKRSFAKVFRNAYDIPFSQLPTPFHEGWCFCGKDPRIWISSWIGKLEKQPSRKDGFDKSARTYQASGPTFKIDIPMDNFRGVTFKSFNPYWKGILWILFLLCGIFEESSCKRALVIGTWCYEVVCLDSWFLMKDSATI